MQQLAGLFFQVEGRVDHEKAPMVTAVHGHADRGVVKAEGSVDAFAWLRVSVLDKMRVQRIKRAAVGDQGDMLLRAGQYFIQYLMRAFHE